MQRREKIYAALVKNLKGLDINQYGAAQVLVPKYIAQCEAELLRDAIRNPSAFDYYEIKQVAEYVDGIGMKHCEVISGSVEDARKNSSYVTDFWTLYGHMRSGGVMALGDYNDETTAETVLGLIGGERR